MSNNIERLKAMLEYHDNLYYNEDNPEITDAEYDAIKSEYLRLSQDNEYNFVPGEASSLFEKVEHTHPISSLAKVNSYDELRKEMKRLAPFVIELKMDGLTVVGYPGTTTKSGKFATRGNGVIGEDITHTAIKIDGINQVEKVDEPVRLEAYMKKSTFEALNEERIAKGEEPFKNPRNATAGMLRNKDASKVKGVSYVAFNIVGSTKSETRQHEELAYSGFNTVEVFKKPNNDTIYYEDDIDLAISQIDNFDRDALDFEIDGLVIKSNKEFALEVFGETGHHPKSMVAYKFPSQGVWTKLVDVINQVGRTGKITPVAIIEPTELMGSTITRVTLHNYGIMNTLNVSIGCDVYLIKANDVIPAIIETRNYDPLKAIKKPAHCPECDSELDEVNDQQFCRNVECSSKLLFSICHLAKRDALDIEGLAEETVKKVIDADLVKKPFDIFDLTVEQILTLEGFAKRSATKLYNNIQNAKNPDLKNFIYAAGIPEIGRSVSEDIALTFGSLESFLDDIKARGERFSNIEGVGDTLLANVLKHSNLLSELKEKVTPKSVNVRKTVDSDKQLTFVITGKLENPRKYYEEIVKSSGHKISSSVSKNTDYILAGEKAGSKLTKGQELGIKILTTEEELLEALK